MNLMIVEDEPRLRENLAGNLPWEASGIEVVALAASGVEALRLLRQADPEIVLIDIQMPELGGLDFAREALKINPLLQIVILSGHDDFEYARQAIELNAAAYLLKPALDHEIIEAVEKARDQLKRQLEARMSHEELQARWKLKLPELQASLLTQLIFNGFMPYDFERHCREVALECGGRHFVAVAAELDPLSDEPDCRYRERDVPLLRFALMNMAEEYFSQLDGYVLAREHHSPLIVLGSEPGEAAPDFGNRVNVLVNKFLLLVRECLKVTASAGIGPVGELERIALSYRGAGAALKERLVLGPDLAISHLDEEGGRPARFRNRQELEKMLDGAVQLHDADGALRAAEEMIRQWLLPLESSAEVEECVLHFGGLLIRLIHDRDWTVGEVLGGESLPRQMERLATKEHIARWLTSAVREIVLFAQGRRASDVHYTVKRVIAHIEAHVHEQIGLQQLSEEMHVNSSYLSRLFRQSTGLTYSQYVLKLKMEKAKSYLLQGMRASQTAELLGYYDDSYFAKVFRKYWGVPPSAIGKGRS